MLDGIYSICPACNTKLSPKECHSSQQTEDITFFITCPDCKLHFSITANCNAFEIACNYRDKIK